MLRLLSALASLCCVYSAGAQPCEPTWLNLGEIQGVSGSTPRLSKIITFDYDGPGPQPASLLVYGSFSSIGGAVVSSPARFDGTSWTPHPLSFQPTQSHVEFDPDGPGGAPPRYIVTTSGTPAVMEWSGGQWSPINPALPYGLPTDRLSAVVVDHDDAGPLQPALYVGMQRGRNNSIFSTRLWTLDGSSWSLIAEHYEPGTTSVDTVGIDMATADLDGPGSRQREIIYAYRVTSPNNENRYVRGYSPAGGSREVGGLSWFVVSMPDWLAVLPRQLRDVLIAGHSQNSVTAAYVWAHNPPSGSADVGFFPNSIAPAVDSEVRKPVLYDIDGAGPQLARLYFGGSFRNTLNGVNVRNIAAWDGQLWSAVPTSDVQATTSLGLWDPAPNDGDPGYLVACCGDWSTPPTGVPGIMALSGFGGQPAVWTDGAGGSFSDASNWQGGTVPSPLAALQFDARANMPAGPGQYTVTLTDQRLACRVEVRSSKRVTMSLGAGVNSAGELSLTSSTGDGEPSLLIGDEPGVDTRLAITNGSTATRSLTATDAVVARTVGSNGTLTVNGSSARYSSTSATTIGDGGVGQFSILQRGTGDCRSLVIGRQVGSFGSVSVTGQLGSASTLQLGSVDAGDELVVGDQGLGALAISSAGRVLTNAGLDQISIGRFGGSSGTVSLTGVGTQWTTASVDFIVGDAGSGTLSISSGATFTTNTLGQLVIGRLPGGTGVATIGSSSSWTENNQSLLIGGEGSGSLTVEQGGSLNFAPGLGVNIGRAGTLAGAGTINGTVFNFGVLRPGTSSDSTSMFTAEDYAQVGVPPGSSETTTGGLYLDIAGTSAGQFDQLVVSGFAELAGGLIVTALAPWNRTLSGPLTLITASSGITGFFDVALLPPTGQPETFFLASTQPITGREGERAGDAVVLTVQPLSFSINTSVNDIDNLGGRPSSAVIGDFDGVNGPDLAVVIPDATNPAGANGSLTILYNNGSSNGVWNGWTAGTVQYPVGRNPSGIAAGHFDAPGAPGVREDLVISNAADDSVIVLRNNNLTGVNQQFVSPQTFAVGDEPTSVVAADLDADGLADVATSNRQSSTVSILQNRGVAGAWLGLGQTPGANRVDLSLGAGSEPLDIAAARLNRPIGATPDAPELVTANAGDSTISIIDNVEGSPTWAARFIFPPVPKRPVGPYPTTINPINPDEDKFDDDIVTTNALGDSVSIFRNDIAGAGLPISLRPHVELPVGDDPSSLAEVDLDGDGDGELAVIATVNAARVVRVLRNDTTTQGEFTFSLDNNIAAGANPVLLLAADVDLAGGQTLRDDLIVLNDQTLLGRGVTEPARSTVVLAVPPPCPGDATNDGVVNFADITAVLGNFGTVYGAPPATGPGDADGNGTVSFGDVASVLANFGTTCS